MVLLKDVVQVSQWICRYADLSLWKDVMCRIGILSVHYSGSIAETAFSTAWTDVAWTEC